MGLAELLFGFSMRMVFLSSFGFERVVVSERGICAHVSMDVFCVSGFSPKIFCGFLKMRMFCSFSGVL